MSAPSQMGQQDPDAARRTGLIAGLTAYILWGLLPIYIMQVRDAGALEILIHRILWAVPFAALLITFTRQWPEIKAALANRKALFALFASASIITVNWLLYVWAATNGRIAEASLGYFINPLISVAAGVIILGEPLRRMQFAALTIAVIGVLIMTVGGDAFPTIAIILAISFTTYGYLRKTVEVGALPGLFIEVCLIAPFAMMGLWWMMQSGGAQFGTSLSMTALLIASGPVTVVPLVLFALATRRLRLSTVGLMQYIGPTLQFLLSLHYGERLGTADLICFVLIWTAVAIFAYDSLRADAALKNAPTKPLAPSLDGKARP